MHQGDGGEATEHGEHAMGHVDDMHQAERDRQADRDHEQDHRIGDTVNHDAGKQGHGSSPRLRPLPLRCTTWHGPAVVGLLLVGLEFPLDQLAAGVLLDLADVDVLDDVTGLRINPHRAARTFPGIARIAAIAASGSRWPLVASTMR